MSQIKRALLSVTDKTEIIPLAKALSEGGVELYSSGGTAAVLREAGLQVVSVEEITGNPEAFGGRMKTLSFQISSGLLFRRGHAEDEKEAKDLNIKAIDLVVCNLYRFEEAAKSNSDWDKLIENIDIGGPTMIRAAAKNCADVTVLTNPNQYAQFIDLFKNQTGDIGLEARKNFSLKAFRHTAEYDSLITRTFESRLLGEEKSLFLTTAEEENGKNLETLRYGENPHQRGFLYKDPLNQNGLAQSEALQGKALSYNNYLDMDAGWRSCSDLNRVAIFLKRDELCAVTIIKHSNPCGASLNKSSLLGLEEAWAGDPISAFGSIICFSKAFDVDCAKWLSDKFVEVIIAPEFSDEAREVLSKKKNLRVIQHAPCTKSEKEDNEWMIRTIDGGWAIQNEDREFDREFQQVTKKGLDSSTKELALFGVIVTKHLKSNAISLVQTTRNGFQLMGAGMGNPNRLISLEQAVLKAKENGHADLSTALLISDAFFPFSDNIDLAHGHGLTQIVQPGGSIKDKDVIQSCDEREIAMVFTGKRHFRH
jgi:phosphoribosylaminoimidazolecarboxamide formyltransferase / IMP cyclohydrolase